jgi:putative DNA methylase
MQKTTTTLTPLALKDAPALIETVFPAQKVSFEAQKERKAGLGQTLTGLGPTGRAQAADSGACHCAGSLLPPTDDAEADLALFEKLMALTTRAWRAARWRPTLFARRDCRAHPAR